MRKLSLIFFVLLVLTADGDHHDIIRFAYEQVSTNQIESNSNTFKGEVADNNGICIKGEFVGKFVFKTELSIKETPINGNILTEFSECGHYFQTLTVTTAEERDRVKFDFKKAINGIIHLFKITYYTNNTNNIFVSDSIESLLTFPVNHTCSCKTGLSVQMVDDLTVATVELANIKFNVFRETAQVEYEPEYICSVDTEIISRKSLPFVLAIIVISIILIIFFFYYSVAECKQDSILTS